MTVPNTEVLSFEKTMETAEVAIVRDTGLSVIDCCPVTVALLP
jgi:hypothetical protein